LSDYSEKELLILSNYVYFDSSVKAGTIGENIDRLKGSNGLFDIEKIYKEGAISCNISETEAISILNKIDNDEKLRNLSAVRILEEDDIRGVCYVGKGESEGCLVFRGTGGTYEAWHDNVTGEYEADTKLQKLAGDFVKYECSEYKSLVVTGHSKGGNLAQYVTVTNGDRIERCISFDGQGFGRDFLNKYSKEIKEAGPKITSVSAYNDYVNILLYGIAGSSLYVKNKGIGIDGHSSGSLLDSVVFKENGDIDRAKSGLFQGPLADKLEEVTNNAVRTIDLLPDEGRKKATDILASLIAGYMSYDESEDGKRDKTLRAVADFKEYAKSLVGITEYEDVSINITNESNYYSGNSMMNASLVMEECSKKICILAEGVEVVMSQKDINLPARCFIDGALEKIADKLYRESERLRSHSKLLGDIYCIFEKDEKGICDACRNAS